MGIGDNLMASGLARGAKERGKLIAFGDGTKLLWDQFSKAIFQDNPNIATPANMRVTPTRNIEWVPFYKGNRIYNSAAPGRWVWNYEFKAKPGELFFSYDERKFSHRYVGNETVVIEPNLPAYKSVSVNKRWPVERYREVARRLIREGRRVVQFDYGSGERLPGVESLQTPSFRHAAAILSRAALYIGPEGGLHHAAAAVNTPAVVLFGGFIPPQVTGYDGHVNLTGGAEACGSWNACEHCRAAMNAISVEEVVGAASQYLKVAA